MGTSVLTVGVASYRWIRKEGKNNSCGNVLEFEYEHILL